MIDLYVAINILDEPINIIGEPERDGVGALATNTQ